jgi:hypothetical protein
MLKYCLPFLIVILWACNKNEPKSIIYGYEYFPTEAGHYRVYQVMDIFHDEALGNVHDTSIYQIKEVIGEMLIDEEGDTIQKLRRYFRENDTSVWNLQDVWTQKRTRTTAEVVEENKRRIKMVYAISYDQSWNGNALNNETAQNCYYDHIYESYNSDYLSFDSTVVVEQMNFSSFIDYQRQYEIYARNIGCIKVVNKQLEIDNADTTDIQYGTEIFYDLIEFGKE